MSINARIIAAVGEPIAPDVYTGPELTYHTFNYNTIPAIFADDAPGCERYLIQVHFYCPREANSVARCAEIKRALFAAGFSWPEMLNASDGSGQHWVFEFEDVEGIGEDGADG